MLPPQFGTLHLVCVHWSAHASPFLGLPCMRTHSTQHPGCTLGACLKCVGVLIDQLSSCKPRSVCLTMHHCMPTLSYASAFRKLQHCAELPAAIWGRQQKRHAQDISGGTHSPARPPPSGCTFLPLLYGKLPSGAQACPPPNLPPDCLPWPGMACLGLAREMRHRHWPVKLWRGCQTC